MMPANGNLSLAQKSRIEQNMRTIPQRGSLHIVAHVQELYKTHKICIDLYSDSEINEYAGICRLKIKR